MWSIKVKIMFLMASVIGYLVACGPQTSQSPLPKVEQTVNGDSETTLSVTEGAAAGTQVNIPVGALAVGSTVDVGRVDTPNELSIASTISASAAIEVSAKDSSGNAVSELLTPMTIAIPYSASAGLVQVAGNEENLCALLKSASGLFLWRYSDLTILSETKKVSLKSKYLGVFKLVYCGQEKLDGFNEASDTGASGDLLSVKLSLDTKAYGSGVDHFCMAIISEKDDESKDSETKEPAIVLAVDEGLSDGSTISLSGSFSGAKLAEGYSALVVIITQSSGQSCDSVTVGSDIDATNLQLMDAYIFVFSKDELAAGSGNGNFGVGAYALKSIKLQIGNPNTTIGTQALAPFAKSPICFHGESDKGFAVHTLSVDASGKINGQDNIELLIPSAYSLSRVEYEVGRDCGPGDGDRGNGSFEPYSGVFPLAKFGDQLYLVPTNISADAIYDGKTVCLEVLPGGTLATNTSTGNGDSRLFSASLQFGTKEYNAYIPYHSETNDLRINVGATCDNYTGGSTTTVSGEPVDGYLYVSPPTNL